MKKLIAFLFIIIVLSNIIIVKANETPVDDGADIMIIIDKSLSMSWHDPDTETLEAMNHILNLNLGTKNRVGFVVYNDTIIAYQELQKIETQNDIDEIMNKLRGLQISRGTDVGLALQMARRQLRLDDYREKKTAIIFLSDGYFGFNLYNPNRNHDDVANDVEDVLTAISYPIFTIQYSVLEFGNQTLKDDWGNQTGGAHFTASNPDELTYAVEETYRLIMEMVEYEINRMYEIHVYEYQLAEVENAEPYENNITMQMVGSLIIGMVSWEIIGIGLGVIVILLGVRLLVVSLLKKRQIKKKYPNLSGTLECYFMEIPIGTKDIPIQSWSAPALAANSKVSLNKLLKNVSLRSEMPEAEKIFASISADNIISITNKAGIECYKNGKEITDKQITLRHGEGLYMIFQKNIIEIELRARKGNSN